jgi:hypothetical protein
MPPAQPAACDENDLAPRRIAQHPTEEWLPSRRHSSPAGALCPAPQRLRRGPVADQPAGARSLQCDTPSAPCTRVQSAGCRASGPCLLGALPLLWFLSSRPRTLCQSFCLAPPHTKLGCWASRPRAQPLAAAARTLHAAAACGGSMDHAAAPAPAAAPPLLPPAAATQPVLRNGGGGGPLPLAEGPGVGAASLASQHCRGAARRNIGARARVLYCRLPSLRSLLQNCPSVLGPCLAPSLGAGNSQHPNPPAPAAHASALARTTASARPAAWLHLPMTLHTALRGRVRLTTPLAACALKRW